MIQKIPLKRIKTHPDLQMRAGPLLVNRVEHYAEMRRDGLTPPPIRVVLDAESEVYWLVDGHYRAEAYRLAGETLIEAEVEMGGFDRAIWLAAAANKGHGLERDAETVQNACRAALGVHWEWSDRRLAEHVGTSASTVLRARRQMIRDGHPDDGVRVGFDGRSRSAAPAPAAPPSDQDRGADSIPEHIVRDIEATLQRRPGVTDETLAEWHDVEPAIVAEIRERLARDEEEASRGPDGVDEQAGEDFADDDGGDDGDDTAEEEGESTASLKQLTEVRGGQRCSVGLVIPDELLLVWNDVWAAGERLLKALADAAVLVREVAQMPGGEAYAYSLAYRESTTGGSQEVKFSSVHLRNARTTVLGNLPYASVCPECVRQRAKRSVAGCACCNGRGWLPRSVWENFPSHQREAAVEFVQDRGL